MIYVYDSHSTVTSLKENNAPPALINVFFFFSLFILFVLSAEKHDRCCSFLGRTVSGLPYTQREVFTVLYGSLAKSMC